MIEVNMSLINKDRLEEGCIDVINVLKPYSKEEKIAILFYLMDSFPEPYKIVEVK
jgi:hypothetical protein